MSSGILRQHRGGSSRQLGEFPSSGARLLGGISSKIEREPGVSAIILWDNGERDTYESVRLLELTRKCWADESTEALELLCRRLRFLHDTSKKDFLLRSSGEMIFVRSDFVRAVIEPNRVIFLGVENKTFDQFFREMEGELESELAKEIQLKENSDASKPFNNRPFQIWVVDCIVCANVTLHNLRLQVLAPVAQSILDNIRLDRCEDAILQLYPVKMALSTFIEQVRPLVHCLLHGSEDGRENRGSLAARPIGRCTDSWNKDSWTEKTPKNGSLHSGNMRALEVEDQHKVTFHVDSSRRVRRESEDHESLSSFPMEMRPGSLEEVLDNWTHNAEEMMADATELSGSMDDAIRFLEASMSCMRNRLLQLELGTEVTALVFALGALVSGIFGMNLHTGIEDAPGYFVMVVVFIVGCGGMIVAFALWVIWRSKRHYQDHSARFGNNMFFRSFGDDEYILRELGTRITDTGALPDDVLTRVLQDLQKPALPVRDRRRMGGRDGGSYGCGGSPTLSSRVLSFKNDNAGQVGSAMVRRVTSSRNIDSNSTRIQSNPTGSNISLLAGSSSSRDGQ